MSKYRRWEDQLGQIYHEMTQSLELDFGEELDITGHPLQEIQDHIEKAIDGLSYFGDYD
jgi:hypothetical protein